MNSNANIKYDPSELGMSPDLIADIRSELISYDSDSVEYFLHRLNLCLLLVSIIKKGFRPSLSDIREHKNKIKKALDKLISQVELFHCEVFDQSLLSKNFHPSKSMLKTAHNYIQKYVSSTDDWGSLYKIKSHLDKELSKKRSGRPLEFNSDWREGMRKERGALLDKFFDPPPEIAIESFFDRVLGAPPLLKLCVVSDIAALFAEYFEEPSYYRDGPFYNVVKHSLKFLGLPWKAPDRVIKSIINARRKVKDGPHI